MKKNTSGMKDIFEEAQKDVMQKYNDKIAEKERSRSSNKSEEVSHYDNGQSDIEDRNDDLSTSLEIRALERQRDAELAALTIEKKKQK